MLVRVKQILYCRWAATVPSLTLSTIVLALSQWRCSLQREPVGVEEAGEPLVHLAPLLLEPTLVSLALQHRLQLVLKHLPAPP
jgi:hypothetical protein